MLQQHQAEFKRTLIITGHSKQGNPNQTLVTSPVASPIATKNPSYDTAMLTAGTSQNIPNTYTALPGTSLEKPFPACSQLFSFTRTIFSQLIEPCTEHVPDHVFLETGLCFASLAMTDTKLIINVVFQILLL